ncbi:MAG TPA: amidohydrolase family protein, partial [Anaerolineales bacterium]|nr:amidohydrolase family protein [Anaerolineales bacterium]
MKTRIDLLIHSASELLTIPNGPQRGANLGELGIIEDGALAAHEGEIVAVGKSADLRSRYQAEKTIDATGNVVMPGFVDPHTHLVWAGDRANEFEMRIAGATYMEIMNAGGGIMS